MASKTLGTAYKVEGTITLHVSWTLAHEDPGHKNTANKYWEFIF